MKKVLSSVGALALSLGLVGSASAAGNGQADLAQIRQATVKYHNVETAIADGYVPVPLEANAAIPDVATMGLHYINFSLMADPEIDPLKPEILIYVPSNDQKDGVKLVAVEYAVSAETWSPDGENYLPGWSEEEAPSILGQTFEGPMPGHVPGEPAHYDKHLWLWQANPKGFNIDENGINYEVPGMFSQWNPNIK